MTYVPATEINTEKMVIEKLRYPTEGVTVNGKSYKLNVREIEVFLQHCASFMPPEHSDFETITQIISDQLVDNANANTSVEELRTQLKFLREVSFLLKSIVSPADNY